MRTIKRSALFKRQLLQITSGYRERAGSDVAVKFVDEFEESVKFIAARPLFCSVYTRLEGKEFRKWRVGHFPVSVFFRMQGADVIILEALYAHRMDIATRFPDESE